MTKFLTVEDSLQCVGAVRRRTKPMAEAEATMARRRLGLAAGGFNFLHKRDCFIACLTFALSLVVAQHAASQSISVIDQVLVKSEQTGSSVIVKLSGNPAYKVIGIQKKEILIALKNTEFSQRFYSKQITDDKWIQEVEVNKRPDNVICFLVKLRKPYIRIDHEMEAGRGKLWVNIIGEAGMPGATSVTVASDKALKPAVLDSSVSQTKTTDPLVSSRRGIIDQLLNPDSRDNKPDTRLFLQAAAHFQMGRWRETVQILREILDSYPDSRHLERAYFFLAKTFNRMFEKEISDYLVEVKKHYQDAISRYPGSVFVADAMVSIGNCYAKAENYYEALAYYNLVCENYKTDAAAAEALFQKGKILTLIKKPREAVESFQKIEALYPETSFAREVKIEKAKAFFDMNSFNRSLRTLDKIMFEQPNKIYEGPDVLLYSGYCNYELGKLKKARDYLVKTFNYYPDVKSNHLILTRIADTYRDEAGKSNDQVLESKAAKLYNLVLKSFPDSEGNLISMLRLAANMKDEPKRLFPPLGIEEMTPYNKPAPEIYKEIIETRGDSPLSPLAGLRLGLRQHEDKDYEGSINTLRGVLAQSSDSSLREQIRAALRAPVKVILEREQRAGNHGEIVGYYEQIKQDLGTEEMPNLLLIVGDAYRRLHLYDRAISAFEEARKSYTTQDEPAILLYGLGESFYKVQRFEEAEKLLRDFVTRYPKDGQSSQAHFLVGDIMQRKKEHEKATAAFRLAMKEGQDEPHEIKVLLAMANVASSQQDYEEASRLLNKAIELSSRNKIDSFPETYGAYKQLAEVYMKLEDNGQAVSAFEKALALSPKGEGDHGLRFRLAECYQRLQERDKTEEILNEIIASGDPFWSRMAEAKIKEMNINRDFEKLDRGRKT